jgi:hypothetical protein
VRLVFLMGVRHPTLGRTFFSAAGDILDGTGTSILSLACRYAASVLLFRQCSATRASLRAYGEAGQL